jgi:hypothetical protein
MSLGITEAIRQLRYYDMREVMKQRHVPHFSQGAPLFVGTFGALHEVMKEMEYPSAYDPSSRPSTSSSVSGGSKASKSEDNVRELCKLLIRDSLRAVGELEYISWDRNNLMLSVRCLCSLSFSILIFLVARKHQTGTRKRRCN